MSPASLVAEEKALNVILKAETWTASTKLYLGLSSLKPSELLKKTTAKEFGEKEPEEAHSWRRVEISGSEKPGWEVTKGEAETGFTKYVNKNAIKTGTEAWEFAKLTSGVTEIKLETFAICEKLKASEAGNILV